MDYFNSKGVWHKVERATALARIEKSPIRVRWVDVNKGDDDHPNYRSRLVAREIRRKREDSIFASTPPLEALAAILSLTATEDFWPEEVWHAPQDSESRLQISTIDISRAYFNARTKDSDPVYVELPPEDPDFGKGFFAIQPIDGCQHLRYGFQALSLNTIFINKATIKISNFLCV